MCNKAARASFVRGEEEVALERRARTPVRERALASSGEIAEDLWREGDRQRSCEREREKQKDRVGPRIRAPSVRYSSTRPPPPSARGYPPVTAGRQEFRGPLPDGGTYAGTGEAAAPLRFLFHARHRRGRLSVVRLYS